EHRIGAQKFADNMRHRVRWYRSTRCSRPAGYLAQIFTYPLPFAALTMGLAGGTAWSWWLLGACAMMRLIAALATARTLGDILVWRNLHWLPVQDGISFAVWCVALFGRKILWRGRAFEVTADGRLRAAR
ncbi:MAG: ceramide glucosyltransferase, partial [Bryobacterales bacterium]